MIRLRGKRWPKDLKRVLIEYRDLPDGNKLTLSLFQRLSDMDIMAKIGKIVEENPDLTYSMVKDILIGLEELEQGETSEYKFG